MSAPTTRSAYPVPVDELLPQAREMAAELGALPSRNRLMTALKIGAPKASTIRARLRDETESAPQGRHLDLPTSVAEPEAVFPEPHQRSNSNETAEEVTQPLPAVSVDPPESTDKPVANPDSSPGHGTTTEPASPKVPAQATASADPAPHPSVVSDVDDSRPVAVWPVLLLALPAFVAIWSGWVGLGGLTGFGIVRPLPGIADGFALNTAITLPIGVETYAAYALRIWLSGRVPAQARQFAKCSALGSLGLGALGQVAYHLMTATGITTAPWWITTAVSCLPVAVLGMGAALTHLMRTDNRREVA
jgi:hypothetical protein